MFNSQIMYFRCADAVEALGIPMANDINTSKTPAVVCGKLHVTIDSNSRRCSTFDAFLSLDVALSRKAHLKICTGTVASSLHIKDDRAVGVYFREERETEPGRTFYARALREVVVCCGAIGSPQLLMLR